MTSTEKNPLKKILIIDDEPDLLEIIKLRLEAEGFEVMVAEGGEKGFHLAKEKKPDLIFLDIMMPGLNGFETAVLLQKDPLTRSVPIVLLTAKTQDADREEGTRVGAVDYIVKPFEINDFINKINIYLP